MVRSPRVTLAAAIEHPYSLDLALLVIGISAVSSAAFLLTPVGRLAALDQQVRQLESFGTIVTDELYASLRRWQRYRPLFSAALIAGGWPVAWGAIAAIVRAIGNRVQDRVKPTFAQVFTVLVHASAILALREVVALPINYLRESLGGGTSLAALLPGLGDATFAARLFGAIDLFIVWWVLLVAIGFGMLYRTRAFTVARWLFGAYATGAAGLALTQALRGGI